MSTALSLKETMQVYEEIYKLVGDDEPGLKALALKSIGKELTREGNHQEAVVYLEEEKNSFKIK